VEIVVRFTSAYRRQHNHLRLIHFIKFNLTFYFTGGRTLLSILTGRIFLLCNDLWIHHLSNFILFKIYFQKSNDPPDDLSLSNYFTKLPIPETIIEPEWLYEVGFLKIAASMPTDDWGTTSYNSCPLGQLSLPEIPKTTDRMPITTVLVMLVRSGRRLVDNLHLVLHTCSTDLLLL